jgi:hypothetical protein
MVLNGVAGIVLAYVIVAVLLTGLPYAEWTAIAGSTIWCKLLMGFALGRHAHAAAARAKH